MVVFSSLPVAESPHCFSRPLSSRTPSYGVACIVKDEILMIYKHKYIYIIHAQMNVVQVLQFNGVGLEYHEREFLESMESSHTSCHTYRFLLPVRHAMTNCLPVCRTSIRKCHPLLKHIEGARYVHSPKNRGLGSYWNTLEHFSEIFVSIVGRISFA